jgi:hypothetical protein
MKKVVLLSLLMFFATFAVADTLYFYSGDFDPNNANANGLANENDSIVSGNPYGSATFQNFFVSGSAVTVSGLFTNNLSQLNPRSAYWEIRSGMSEGNGGTLIASGTSAVTQTATGRSGFGFTEYQDLVSGLSVNLNPGQYWFAVVPLDPNSGGRSYNSNTFGMNGVGSYQQNAEFWNSAFFGVNYTNGNNGGVFPAFSGGVYVTGQGGVPEPGTLVMMGTGVLGLAGVIRRKLSL